MRRRGIGNNVPECEEQCEGCFAAKDGHCYILSEIPMNCPFKKSAEEVKNDE